jgi:thiol-disulfide isomerase/thioredoxin
MRPAVRASRLAVLLLAPLLVASSARAAKLRDVKEPAAIMRLFPRRAKLRLVNVWATWCAPCVAEIPELRAIGEAFGPELAIIGVSMDDMIPGAKRGQVSAFLDRRKIAYLNVYYRGNADDLSRDYHFDGEIPVTIAFDAAGREVWRHQGALKSAPVIAELRKLLRRMS